MTTALRYSAVAALLATLVALGGCSRDPVETRLRFTAMGTLVEITIYDHPQELAQQAAADVERLFNELESDWDPWEDGDLGRLNRALDGDSPVKPPDDLAALLVRASEIDQTSGGLFEPGIGALTRLWGFSRDETLPTVPPPAETLQKTLAAVVPLPDLWLDDGRLQGKPGMAIDLGGFAKGEAVDRAIELLRDRGISNAIVNAGGDLRAIGRRGDRPWRIGIREPRGEGVLAAIEVSSDESVFTSGDYERFFVVGGRRYHHILDPRDGYPPEDTISVTVIGEQAALADAAATAVFVAGPGGWSDVASDLGLTHVMLVDASGTIHMSPQMESRARLMGSPPPQVMVEEIR